MWCRYEELPDWVDVPPDTSVRDAPSKAPIDMVTGGTPAMHHEVKKNSKQP
jgi:hypothetical protein